jgi:hypothetical protein
LLAGGLDRDQQGEAEAQRGFLHGSRG